MATANSGGTTKRAPRRKRESRDETANGKSAPPDLGELPPDIRTEPISLDSAAHASTDFFASVATATQSERLLDDSALATRAYEIWESLGRPEGRSLEHWLQAESELRQRDDEVAR